MISWFSDQLCTDIHLANSCFHGKSFAPGFLLWPFSYWPFSSAKSWVQPHLLCVVVPRLNTPHPGGVTCCPFAGSPVGVLSSHTGLGQTSTHTLGHLGALLLCCSSFFSLVSSSCLLLWNNFHSFLRCEVVNQQVQQGMRCEVPGFIFAVNLSTWRFFSCLPCSVCLFRTTDSQTNKSFFSPLEVS